MADKTFVFELDLSENENNNEFSYLELVKDKLVGLFVNLRFLFKSKLKY